MAKKITSNHFAVRKTVEGTNTNIDFVPKVRTHIAPSITESFVDDEGNVQHILSNGNTLSENNYILHWGQPKGQMNLKAKNEPIRGWGKLI